MPVTLRAFALAGVVVLATVAGLHRLCASSHARFPEPFDEQPGEREADFTARREAFVASLHRHAPGLVWREQDARYRHARRERLPRTGGDALALDTPARSGTWSERGSGNQAGRVLAVMHDQQNDRITALTHGGTVWRANRSSLSWSPTSDSTRFGPHSNAGYAERLGGAAGERLLVVSENPVGVFRSDDAGATWTDATGIDPYNPYYAQGLAVRDPSFGEVYVLRNDYDYNAAKYRPSLFVSSDRGASFTGLGYVGQRDRTSIHSPRYISGEVFILADAQLIRIVPGTNALSNVSTVPIGAPLVDGDRVVLRGGFANGQVFLYAFYARSGSNQTEVYRSLDGGQTWTARTSVPSTLFGLNSAETSPRDPNYVYAGGVNLYRSADGGGSWTPVNDWTEYYANPATKLHADIASVSVWIDGSNLDRVYIATDGGLYESTNGAVTVQNVSGSGATALRDSQYYGSYTKRAAPYTIVVGSQDQGYQKALAPGLGIQAFEQTVSGDYAHLTSGNGGASVWMVYPGFAQLDTTPGSPGQGGLIAWSFDDNNFRDWLFLPPLAADPANADHVSLAGGNLNSAGHRVVQLTRSGGNITAVQDAYDFADQLTAIAYSTVIPGERYAISSTGHFFRDTGTGWTAGAAGLPGGQYFYGNAILADRKVGKKIYVGGAGYSSPGVYVSTNDGTSFQPMSTGLPDTLVYGLAMTPDGSMLFAATEVGAFWYDTAQARWIDLTTLGAPDQIYWDVDVIPQLGVARFSTYGRGIWDFQSASIGAALFADGFE
jgi:hypothetical protein